MLHINLFCGAPFWMRGSERVLGTNYLAFKIGGQCWMIVGQTWLSSAREVASR